jgi:hypothetical protein
MGRCPMLTCFGPLGSKSRHLAFITQRVTAYFNPGASFTHNPNQTLPIALHPTRRLSIQSPLSLPQWFSGFCTTGKSSQENKVSIVCSTQ